MMIILKKACWLTKAERKQWKQTAIMQMKELNDPCLDLGSFMRHNAHRYPGALNLSHVSTVRNQNGEYMVVGQSGEILCSVDSEHPDADVLIAAVDDYARLLELMQFLSKGMAEGGHTITFNKGDGTQDVWRKVA